MHPGKGDGEMPEKVKPSFSENATRVLERRYLLKDEKGSPTETPEEMLWRVARAVAKAEERFDDEQSPEYWAERFYEVMAQLDFLPNSPTLMNVGTPAGQLSACFVLPIGDSMEEIFDALKYTALVHKSGGGTGFNFSTLRPYGDIVRSTKGVASGPEATPLVLLTISPYGRSVKKLNPVPPPDLCTRAVYLRASNISSMLSPMGSTKHAESCPAGVPAFISVGELGKKSSCAMTS